MARLSIRTRLLVVLLVPAAGLLVVLGALVTQALSVAASAGLDDAARRGLTNLGGIAVGMSIAWALLLVTVLRGVVRPLQQLTTLAGRVRTTLHPAVDRVAHGDPAGPSVFDGLGGRTLTRRTDEVGELARAIRASTDEAIRVASDQARTRAGIIRTIEDVARREQTLVERQLALLDQLEDAEEDPDQLSALFRLDHLATRMRRNAENLRLLSSGDLPGGRDSASLPLVDVVRTAAAEIEQYGRVDVRVGVDATVVGHAATPLSHLLAELVENATQFSPAPARVTVRGRVVPRGVAITITDEGIGMSASDIEDARRRLAEPPLLEAAASRQLGLYVVGLIAGHLGVDVDLAPGPVGRGLAVEVQIPSELFDPPVAAPDPSVQGRLHVVPDLPPVPIPSQHHAVATALHTPPDAVEAMQQLLDAEPATPPDLPDDVIAPPARELPSRVDRTPHIDPGAAGVSLAIASDGRTVDLDPFEVSRLMTGLGVAEDDPDPDAHADPATAAHPHDGVASSWTTPFPRQGA